MIAVPHLRRAALLAAGALAVVAPAARAQDLLGVPVAPPAPSAAAIAASGPVAELTAAGLAGRSGALRAVMTLPSTLLDGALAPGGGYRWEPLLGTRPNGLLGEAAAATSLLAPAQPGIWRLGSEPSYASAGGAAPAVITRVPFAELRAGRINGYRVGGYPARSGRYAPPEGFIEVTADNQDFAISQHFRLRQFLTKDQFSVWPKYLVLDLRLVDKLELVLQELSAMGVRADRMHVMSGYRTPQYNGPGGDGRAALSRHTYGDAADVWVDNDGDGYIDDLNGDGRRDLADAQVILRAVDRVERKHPELVGGAGVYNANSAHGPFIHIDARGNHARW